MLTYQQIVDFYDTVHKTIKDLDDSTKQKDKYAGYRYRVLNDGNEYSVIIPSQSFVSNTSFAILREFDDGATELQLNNGEEGLSFLDGENLYYKDILFRDAIQTKDFSEVLLAAESFDIDAGEYATSSLEDQHAQREKNALERLRHVKTLDKGNHFMAVFEYRLPDDSVYYVAFNKRGLELARQQESFLPYPFYNRVGDLSKVYFLEDERVHYNRSFRDQRNYL